MLIEDFIIKGNVELFPQKGGWYFVRAPKLITDMIKGSTERGLFAIVAKIGQTSWNTSLLPMGDRTHFVALNKKVMKTENISLGITLKLLLNQDRQKACLVLKNFLLI